MYLQSMFCAKIRKISRFSAENFQFLKIKNLCVLHGQVFVMYRKVCQPFKWQISDFMAKVLCGLATLFGLSSSWPALFLFGHTTVKFGHENITGVTCLTDDKFVDTKYPTLFNMYLFCVVIVTFMTLIVLSQRAHDVRMTSYQCRCDVMTSHRRRSDVILTSCACWNTSLSATLFLIATPGNRNIRRRILERVCNINLGRIGRHLAKTFLL